MSDNENKAKRYYWLKLRSTYFNQLEQKKMRRQENGINMQVIYLRMMLSSIDKGGYIYYQGVYETLEEELAEEFGEPLEIIQETLEYLKKNNMISVDDDYHCFIPEVLEHTGSECYSAERMRRLREKSKTSQCDTNVTSCDEEIEKEIEIEREKEKNNITNYQEIISMYNDTCVSFPKVKQLSEKRKRAIKARLNNYTIDDFKTLFEMAESSSFLKGQNNRNWMASFDWLICDANMAKVLDGNYQDRGGNNTGNKETDPGYSKEHQERHDFYYSFYTGVKEGEEDVFR